MKLDLRPHRLALTLGIASLFLFLSEAKGQARGFLVFTNFVVFDTIDVGKSLDTTLGICVLQGDPRKPCPSSITLSNPNAFSVSKDSCTAYECGYPYSESRFVITFHPDDTGFLISKIEFRGVYDGREQYASGSLIGWGSGTPKQRTVPSKKNETVTCFPNPAHDYITLQSDREQYVRVFNEHGAFVWNGELSRQHPLNVRVWSSGIYTLYWVEDGIERIIRVAVLH
jgi:hypothetical protein